MNVIPLEMGFVYELKTEASTAYVEIVDKTPKEVRVKGLDNTIAEWSMTYDGFRGVIVGYRPAGYFLTTEDGVYDISGEDGTVLLWR